jgi:regulatory protein YycI of two-component signal transduction system YycFG
VALVPDYKTSVMLNNLFRNIKENKNLDALEESDDEEEFENDNINKFVYLEKEYNMVCQYNQKHRKWAPLRLARKGDRVVTKKDLFRLEKNNY